MAAKTAVLNLAEMIDLSIGTPEIGTVDFVMLHAVLHCLAQQVRCTDKIVEVRGVLAAFPVGRQADDAETVMVNEFLVEADGQAAVPAGEDQTILVVERLPRNQRGGITPSPIGPDGSGGRPRIATNAADKAITKISSKAGMRLTTSAGAGGGTKEITEGGSKVSPDIGVGETERGAGSADPGAVNTVQGVAGKTNESTPETVGTGKASVEAGGTGKVPAEAAGATGVNIGPTGSAQKLAVSSGERLSLVSLNRFNQLQKSVDDLKSRVYGTTLNNEELLEGVRSQTNLKGITDMWTSLNVSSRLEAAEAGIAKLSSLMQDLIGKDAMLQKERNILGAGGVHETTSQPMDITTAATLPSYGDMPQEYEIREDLSQIVTYLKSLQDELDHLSGEFYNAMRDMGHAVAEPPAKQDLPLPALADAPLQTGHPGDPHITTPTATETATPVETQPPTPVATPIATGVTTPAADGVATPVATPVGTPSTTPLATTITKPAKLPISDKRRPVSPSPIIAGDTNSKIAFLSGKLKDLENKVNEILQVVFPENGNILIQLHALQDQVEKSSRVQYVQPLSTCSDGAPGPSPELMKELQGLMTLYKTVHDMQDQLKEVHATALQLTSEKDERRQSINSLLEQIEFLKAIKLDREDMAVALADKADVRLLARKVSHDKFEMACDDLAKGLEHALGKLNVQESLWQQALDDIQREIETKLDRVELAPIRDFFLKKMKQLQDSLKQMADLRREAEAAGTKSKLLRDVNCISCDAKAYMQTEAGPAMPAKPLQPNISMRPYLTYELDAIRKSQSSNMPQRNMHDWEKIEKQMTTPRPPQKARSETDKHLCNRYCGGSHTTTTAAQRVARLGHFVKQWGPEVLPLTSGFATGDDGKIYKVSEVENASVGPGGSIDVPCTPKPCGKKEKPSSKPTLTLDCRCIGDVLPPKK